MVQPKLPEGGADAEGAAGRADASGGSSMVPSLQSTSSSFMSAMMDVMKDLGLSRKLCGGSRWSW
jgi:hypothetical protein